MVWNLINFIVQAVGWFVIFFLIVGAILTFVAFLKGVLRPLWRLGVGLSKRNIVIIGSKVDCESLSKLLKKSKLFATRNIENLCSREDIEDVKGASVILYKFSDSPLTLNEVLARKATKAALIVYARPDEIKEEHWKLLDEHRNISVCNLRGRLMNDLLTLMMTTGYEK